MLANHIRSQPLRSLLLSAALIACGPGDVATASRPSLADAMVEPPAALDDAAPAQDASEAAHDLEGLDQGVRRPSEPELSVSVDAEVDQIFADYAGAGTPGAAVMVIEDGRATMVKTYGYAQLEGAIPVKAKTNFRLASVTKQFTAMAVLMLVDRGELRLDDSIRSHLPELPDFARDITIRHILQHTSGLRGYGPLVTEVFPAQVRDRGILELMCETDSTYFPPGSKYRYSNSGYALLAMLVERLSGQSFAVFLENNIFGPLGMHDTLAYERGVSTVANRARGYTVSADRVTASDQNVYSAVLGDGGVYSSINDLFKWDQALYTDKLIAAELKREAFTPGLNTYGFGWRIDRYEGHRRVHHGGATCGFRTFIQRFPDDRFSVIVLTNRSKPGVGSLAEEVADLYLEAPSPALDGR